LRSSKIQAIILFTGFLCSITFSWAQPEVLVSEKRSKYPGEHAILLKNERTVKITMVKGVPKVSHIHTTEFLILDKNGMLSLSEENVDFSTFETIKSIDAYTMVPKGKGYKKVSATDFNTRDVMSDGGVFHDGSKVTTFIYPGLVEGAIRHLTYEVEMSEVDFPFGYYFYSYFPTENPSLKIECDTSVHIAHSLYHMNKFDMNYSESEKKGVRTRIWKAPSSMVVKREDYAPSVRYFAPHILAQISHYYKDGQRVNVIQSIEDLHTRYQKNLTEVKAEQPNIEIKQIADSLTANLTNEFDKVKAIYYWVQSNIKYIAFEEGPGGFVPRQPSKVIVKRYGDCKDMASLLYSMMKSVNIPTYLTWIGTRDLPYDYTDFPGGFCDNHMITSYKNNGTIYFLDATNSFQDIRMPTSFIQGKQAFLHIENDKFEIVQVPVMDAPSTFMTDTTRIKIREDKVLGKSKTIISGYYHSDLGNHLLSSSKQELDGFLTTLNVKGNNSYKAMNTVLTNLDNREVPMIMEYDWEVKNYATTYGNEMYINMILEKNISPNEFKADRLAPFELDNKSLDSYTVILEIPEGYQVDFVPKDKTYTSDFVNFDVKYTQKNQEVSMTLSLKLNFLYLSPEQMPAWNEYVKVKKETVQESVQLSKIK
jgi:hypothetical protein